MLYPAILSLFGLVYDSPWIRVVGLSVAVIGFFYIVAGKNEFLPFAKASLVTRAAQLIFFVIIVTQDLLPSVMMLFALVEFSFGIWTYLALRKLDATQ